MRSCSRNVGVSFKDFIGEIFSLILKGALGFLPSIITIVVISVMSGMLKGLNSGFLNENTSEIVDFACFSAILTVIVSEAANMLTLTINTVGRVEKLSAALFPVLLTLMTALGGTSGVNAQRDRSVRRPQGTGQPAVQDYVPCL